MGTIRASIYKQGTRNILENLRKGFGYEGVIEIYNGSIPNVIITNPNKTVI